MGPKQAKIPPIEAIDRDIKGGFRSLIFSPELERVYEDETRGARERYLTLTTRLGAVIFSLFLFSDWHMAPDVLSGAIIVRLGIFVPLLIITALVLSRRPSRQVREGLPGLMTVLSVVAAMTVTTMSRSPDMVVYQAGDILIMVFTAVVQRLQIRYAAATIVGIVVIQLSFAAQLHDMTPRLMANTVLFFLTAAILLLWAAYVLEREQRRSYLFDLRSRLLNDHLDVIAKQDALTGLWNRRHLETVMTSAWAKAQAQPRSMSVILLDIDHFKTFNDSYGHLEGDKCLKRLATCVQAALKDDVGASAVRFGGEEFLIFIERSESDTAIQAAERIKVEIKNAAIPHPALGDGMIVTASLGVATGTAPGLPMTKLVAAADDALYIAKRAGRDRIWTVVINADAVPLSEKAALLVAC